MSKSPDFPKVNWLYCPTSEESTDSKNDMENPMDSNVSNKVVLLVVTIASFLTPFMAPSCTQASKASCTSSRCFPLLVLWYDVVKAYSLHSFLFLSYWKDMPSSIPASSISTTFYISSLRDLRYYVKMQSCCHKIISYHSRRECLQTR